jgi:tetratricopeptide (TPR) repeat protein
MTGADSQFAEAVRSVSVDRRTGDALKARDRTELADKAYELALTKCDEVLRAVRSAGSNPADEAELLGIRGGLLRRLRRADEALASYRLGAEIEATAGLSSTYNRSNEIKLALISGKSTLASAEHDLVALGHAIESAMENDVQAASNAWNYADLGDTKLLVGQTGAAIEAYRTFGKRARSDSPATTLSVLREILDKLILRHDPDAPRLAADLEHVGEVLGRR